MVVGLIQRIACVRGDYGFKLGGLLDRALASLEPVVGAAVSHSNGRLTENAEHHWRNFIEQYLIETAHSTTTTISETPWTVVANTLYLPEFNAWSNRHRTQVKSIEVNASSGEAFVELNSVEIRGSLGP